MTLRIGFIGTGGIAAYHLRNLAQIEQVDVIGFSDLQVDRAAKAASEWSNACILPIGGRVGIDLYTGSGIMELDMDMLKYRRDGRTDEFRSTNNPFYAEDETFLNAVRTGDRSGIQSDYADALKTHRIAMAVNESVLSGQPVRLRP